MSTAIKVENLSKIYRLGEIGTGTISRDIERYIKTRILKQEDPFLKIGETNNRAEKGSSDIVYSLKDINFEIEQGSAVGIIGRNGAGKSTLLKILSRVTSPTTGKINISGRVASLLEVGTGFHPELTGRENIYLNGAILGMRKREIDRKFDEIVDFSGVERYIDTPVKRYSSGMYVRLAFAVAAHLESEILIVDEVLAVGDAEFQKKCLGKMNEVSKTSGRTVLFVSHNMASIQNLCQYSLYLSNGEIRQVGNTDEVINIYLNNQFSNTIKLADIKERKGSGDLIFVDGRVYGLNTDIMESVESFSDFIINLEFKLSPRLTISNYKIEIGINNSMGDRVAWISTNNILLFNDLLNDNKIEFLIKNCPLAPGEYTLNIFSEINNNISDWLQNVIPFSVKEKDYYNTGKLLPSGQGNILLNYSIIDSK